VGDPRFYSKKKQNVQRETPNPDERKKKGTAIRDAALGEERDHTWTKREGKGSGSTEDRARSSLRPRKKLNKKKAIKTIAAKKKECPTKISE